MTNKQTNSAIFAFIIGVFIATPLMAQNTQDTVKLQQKYPLPAVKKFEKRYTKDQTPVITVPVAMAAISISPNATLAQDMNQISETVLQEVETQDITKYVDDLILSAKYGNKKALYKIYEIANKRNFSFTLEQRIEFLEIVLAQFPQDLVLLNKTLDYLTPEEIADNFDSSALIAMIPIYDMKDATQIILNKLGKNSADKLKTKYNPGNPQAPLFSVKNGITLIGYWALTCTNKQEERYDSLAQILVENGADINAFVHNTGKQTVKEIVQNNNPSDKAKEIFQIK